MPIGYKWFSYYQEDEMGDFIIEVRNEGISFKADRSILPWYTILHEQNKGSTRVFCDGLNKDTEVEEDMIDVFLEDFQEFLINRKTTLDSLKLYGFSIDRDTIQKVFECMKSALESRNKKLKVKSIRFKMFDSKQIIRLLQFINPEVLTRINIYFGDFKDKPLKRQDIDDVVDHLVAWNRRLVLIIGFYELSEDKLTSFKRMLEYPSDFKRIQLRYKKKNGFEEDKLAAFFEPFKPSFSKLNMYGQRCIGFNFKEVLRGVAEILKPYSQTHSVQHDCGDQLIERAANDLKVSIEHLISTMNQLDLWRNEDVLNLIRNVLKPEDSVKKFLITNERILPYLDLIERINNDGLSLQNIRSLKVLANPLLIKIILKEIHFFDVQSLRKVSRDIRSCIDLFKPDPHIASYKIREQYRIKGSDKVYHLLETHIMLQNGNEKIIRHPTKEIFWCDDNPFDDSNETVADFKLNTRHQESRMNCLSLESNKNLLELLGNVLKLRDTPLLVKELRMEVKNENEIMSILQYLDSVEFIHISLGFKEGWNISNVVNLDQWKNALKLEMRKSSVENSIQDMNIINFKEIDMKIARLTTEDVIYLKENILKDPNFNEFKIKFENSLIDNNLYTSMPPYRRVPDSRSVWFFPMPYSNDFLHILLYEQKKLIVFKRVDRDSVPEDFFD